MKNFNSYYAVIFSSQRSNIDEGYAEMNDLVFDEIESQPGYLGYEANRGENGFGINVSYWKDMESIMNWKNNALHKKAKLKGIEKWYSSYRLRIAKVEYDKQFVKEDD